MIRIRWSTTWRRCDRPEDHRATVQLVVNEQEPVFLQVLRGPIVVAGGGGVTVHNDLTGRSDPDAHPIVRSPACQPPWQRQATSTP